MAEPLEPFVVTSPLSEDKILFIDTSLTAAKSNHVDQSSARAKNLYLNTFKRTSIEPPTPYTASSASHSPLFSPSGSASLDSPASSVAPEDEYKHIFHGIRQLGDHDVEKLRTWNGIIPAATEVGLHELILEQAQKSLNDDAINAWDGKMTYEELNRKTSELAQIFIGKGVRPGNVVPVVFEKSLWAVVAMIAALRAGAAFVAIDASYPAERISNMVAQLDATVVATSDRHIEKLREACPHLEIMVVATTTFNNQHEDDGATGCATLSATDPASAAYLIFTSGSTGKPKGVVIEHSQASTSIASWSRILRMNSSTRSFNFSSFAFDASILDIFCPLLVGGCVCIPSEWSRLNDLAGAITDLQANFGVFTPSLLHSLSYETFPGLDKLLLVGEPISDEVYKHWSQTRQKEVFCGYGPAEITLGCTLVDPTRDSYHAGFLGHSFNSALWVADPTDSDVLLPIGEVGELLVEGPIVARQYINNPEATRTSFITAPEWLNHITKRSGPRLYKTGDLVRYTENGALIFEGRKDTQVKIHGQRVEIGEIEVALRKALGNSYPLAVEVKTSKLQTSANGLVAFIEIPDELVSPENNILSTSSATHENLSELTNGLNQILQKSLPCYMVPREYLAVNKLPLTDASKLDRKRLRALANEERPTIPQTSTTSRKNSMVEQFSSIEEKIHQLWRRVLPKTVSNITLDTNFFNAGGDSLCVMNLVSVAREGGLFMDYALVRKAPTIRQLAIACSSSQPDLDAFDDNIAPFSLLPPTVSVVDLRRQAAFKFAINEDMIEDIMPACEMAEWAIRNTERSPGTFQASLVFPIAEGVDLAALKEIWLDMLREDPNYRTRFLVTEEKVWAIILREDPVEVQTAPDLDTAMVAIRARGTDHTQSILTYIIPKTATSSAQLILSTHHARYDSIALQGTAIELDKRYRHQPVFRKRPVKSVVAWWEYQPADRSHAFWRKHHAGADYKPLIPEVPVDAKPSCTTMALKEVPLTLPAGLEGIPLSSIVVAAWGLVLAEESRSPDAAMTLASSGRIGALSGMETTLGLLIRRVPLRVATKASNTVHELVLRVAADMEETRDNSIIREDTFRAVSTECDAWAKHNVMINFISLPEAVPDDNLVGFPTELSHIGPPGSELGIPVVVGGYMRSHAVTMLVAWDKRLCGDDLGHRLMGKFEKVLAQLMSAPPEMKVDDVVIEV